MKRTTRTIALVLCLILCAFAFASCDKGKKGATTANDTSTAPITTATPAATTEADETLPPHVHVVPDYYDDPDLEPTCIAEGEKSKYCLDCGALIEGSTVKIPINPNAHRINEWIVIDEATIFHDGLKTGHCVLCDRDINEVYSSIVETKYTAEKSGKVIAQAAIYDEVQNGGEKHFYPTEANPGGLDLFVEYSILWNPTLKNINSGDPIYSTRIGGANDSGTANDIIWMSLKDSASGSDCIFAGGYEYGGLRTVEVGPAKMSTDKASDKCSGSIYTDFPNIGGSVQADYDNLNNGHEWGWHRIGVRLHEELLNEAELVAYRADAEGEKPKAKYLMWAECYIDGELIFKLSNAETTVNGESTIKDENLLFTAEADGEGGITYIDIADTKYILGVRAIAETANADGAYFIYGDFKATAGTSFVQNVTKVSTPAANVYTAKDGTEINAPVYYSINVD